MGTLEPSTKLKIVCAWCGKSMGEKEGFGVEGVSHSMCKKCWKSYFPDKPYPKD